MRFKHIELKSGRKIKRYEDICPTCSEFKGYKDQNALGRDCCSCANIKIGFNNRGSKRSEKTRLKQSNAAIKRYNDPTWKPQDRSKRGYSNINATKVYLIKNTPEQNKLKHTIRTLINQKLKNRNLSKKGRASFDILGYSVKELKKHLEDQFKEGMSWNNHGKWHIDHIKPDSSFNYSSVDDKAFKQSWSLDNLQPLWAKDNLSKGAKCA